MNAKFSANLFLTKGLVIALVGFSLLVHHEYLVHQDNLSWFLFSTDHLFSHTSLCPGLRNLASFLFTFFLHASCRCLRTVCNSLNLFITFSMHEKIVDRSSCKKGKMYLNDSNVQVEASSIPVKDISSSLEDKCKRDFGCNHKHYKTTSQLFKKAKNCLLSLKHSVESLHRKNLFPYNPEVLLKRCVFLNCHPFI